MDWAKDSATWPNTAHSRFVSSAPHRWHVQDIGEKGNDVKALERALKKARREKAGRKETRRKETRREKSAAEKGRACAQTGGEKKAGKKNHRKKTSSP